MRSQAIPLFIVTFLCYNVLLVGFNCFAVKERKMGRRSYLLPFEVIDIKSMLWNGTPPAQIMQKYILVKPTTLSSIKWGRLWAGIPWPNGSLGAISEERNRELLVIANQARELAPKMDHRKSPWGPPAMTDERAEDYANTRRVDAKMGLPPKSDEELEEIYQRHLASRRELEQERDAKLEKKRQEERDRFRKEQAEYEKKGPVVPIQRDPYIHLRPLKGGKPNIPDLMQMPDEMIRVNAQAFPKFKDEILAVIAAKKQLAKKGKKS